MLRLAANRALPVKAQPGQIAQHGVFKGGAATGGVDVLQAQQEAAAGVARRCECGEGGEGVAAVGRPAGRRGETGDEGPIVHVG
jgi:hypothetical protein